MDLPHGHAAGVRRDDLLVESGEATLVLADDQRLVADLMSARHVDIDWAIVGEHSLAAGLIALAGAAARLGLIMLVAQVLGYLGTHRALHDRLHQGPVDRLELTSGVIWTGDQLTEKFLGNLRLSGKQRLGRGVRFLLSRHIDSCRS